RLSRINQPLKIRTRTELLDRVDRIGLAEFGTNRALRDYLATGGKTNDADGGGIHVPFLGAAAHEANRALAIRHALYVPLVRLWSVLRRRVIEPEAIFENEGGDAVIGQPLRDIETLVLVGKIFVSATRTHDDGATGGLFLRGQENHQRRVV